MRRTRRRVALPEVKHRMIEHCRDALQTPSSRSGALGYARLRRSSSAVESRITDKFPVRSDSRKVRMIVCSQDHVERGGQGGTQKYYVPIGLKSYYFEDGEPAAKIGDTFLDCAGEIYRR